LSERDHFEDFGVVGSIILKCIFKKQGWIDRAEDRDKWRILVKIAKNFRPNKISEISWLVEKLLASQDEFGSIYLVTYKLVPKHLSLFRDSASHTADHLVE